MVQQVFGSQHTVEKLEKLEAYLRTFLRVFQNQDWAHTIYFDAFAGTGEVPLRNRDEQLPFDELDTAFIVGSAQRALRLDLKFHEYIFVEKNKKRATALRTRLAADYPDRAHLIDVRPLDANQALLEMCRNANWKHSRGVVFLDPFGSQVAWSTIEAIAGTKAIDLWYLFPAGLSVHRQLGNNGTVHYTHEASITRLFGTPDWRDAFLEQGFSEPDLFGESHSSTTKTATPESVTKFMLKRMSQIFDGGVLDEWLPLGRNGGHWYSLIFACANPSKNASKLALKLAKAVIRSGRRGRRI